jgi:hypothetical protein
LADASHPSDVHVLIIEPLGRGDQGGVSKSFTNKLKPPVFVAGRSSGISQTPTPPKADEILAEEEQILE